MDALRLALRRRLPRTLLAAISVLSLLTTPSRVGADTATELDAARARMTQLQDELRAEQGRLEELRGSIADMARRVAEAQTDVERLQVRQVVTEQALLEADAEYAALRSRLDDRARQMYIEGPLGSLESMLGADSLSDLVHTAEYVGSVAESDARLAAEVDALRGDLTATRLDLADLVAERAAAVAGLAGAQEELGAALGEQDAVVAGLGQRKAELEELIDRLSTKLRQEEIAAAMRVATSVPASFGDWAALLAGRLQAPVCSNNLVAIVAWQVGEGTTAAYNPLATTMPMEGAATFNSHGVRNYVSLEQGLDATVLTLARGWDAHGYGAIVESLRRCGDPMATAEAINASNWCAGCAEGAYVVNMVASVAAYLETYTSGSTAAQGSSPFSTMVAVPAPPEPAQGTSGIDWDAIAQCESTGNWSINTGNGYWGGLQFLPSTWFAAGGGPFDGEGSFPYSREYQIGIAERWTAMIGGNYWSTGGWPVCGEFG